MDEFPKIIPVNLELGNFFSKNWSGWRTWRGPIDGNGLEGEEDIDPRSLALTELEVSKIIFESCLKEGESPITGEEKVRRQKESDKIRLGANIFLPIWQNYEARRHCSKDLILDWLYFERKIYNLDFTGTILRDPQGNRRIIRLVCSVDYHGYIDWNWGCDYLRKPQIDEYGNIFVSALLNG